VNVLAGPFAIAAALIVVGGALKALQPHDTANALAAMRLPHAPPVVRAGGAVEAVIGVGALVLGGPVFAALVAVSYLAFAAFVLAAIRAHVPIASCGCFGKADTPPSIVHVVIDLAAGVVAAAVAARSVDVSLAHVVDGQPLLGVPFLGLVAIGMYLVFVAFTDLPTTMAAVRALRELRERER
jgi:hypothetical protein